MSTMNGEFRTTVFYAHVHEPSKYGHFEINLAVTPEMEKELTSLRLDGKIKAGKEAINNGGKYLALRTTQVDRSNNTSSMVIVGADGRPMKDLVGNGSECIVYWRAYDDKQYGRVIKFGKMLDWDQDAKTKTFAGLKVINLVEYKNDKNDFYTPVEGTSSTPSPARQPKEVSFELED